MGEKTRCPECGSANVEVIGYNGDGGEILVCRNPSCPKVEAWVRRT